MSEILIGWNHSLLHHLSNSHCLGHVIRNPANVITFGHCNGSNVITFVTFGLSGSQFCKCNYIWANVITFAQMQLHSTLAGSPPGEAITMIPPAHTPQLPGSSHSSIQGSALIYWHGHYKNCKSSLPQSVMHFALKSHYILLIFVKHDNETLVGLISINFFFKVCL